jgi:hypothetical protein
MPVSRVERRGLRVVVESDSPVGAAGPDRGRGELKGVLERGYGAG